MNVIVYTTSTGGGGGLFFVLFIVEIHPASYTVGGKRYKAFTLNKFDQRLIEPPPSAAR